MSITFSSGYHPRREKTLADAFMHNEIELGMELLKILLQCFNRSQELKLVKCAK